MKLVTTLLTAAALTSSCGWFPKSKDEAVGIPDLKDANLVGTWERDCEKYDLLGARYRKVKLVVGGLKSYTREQTIFSDSGCNGERYVEKQTGTWDIVGTMAGDDGVKQINFTVKDASVNVRNDNVSAEFNLIRYCGLTSWKNGEDRKVLNIDCSSGFKDSQVISDVARVEDRKLFFGKTGFNLTNDAAGKRPSALDRDRPYSKK